CRSSQRAQATPSACAVVPPIKSNRRAILRSVPGRNVRASWIGKPIQDGAIKCDPGHAGPSAAARTLLLRVRAGPVFLSDLAPSILGGAFCMHPPTRFDD